MVIDLEDTHGLQGSMKTQLPTGTTSGGCRPKSGAPTSSKERERRRLIRQLCKYLLQLR